MDFVQTLPCHKMILTLQMKTQDKMVSLTKTCEFERVNCENVAV